MTPTRSKSRPKSGLKPGRSLGTDGGTTAPKIGKDLEGLLNDELELVREMLTNGSTVEDTVEALKDLTGREIVPRAVENYFRSHGELQQARVRHLLQTARELKQALAQPQSSQTGQSELAEAILLTGLMGLSRRQAASRMQHAIRVRDQQENLRLKEDSFRLKSEKFDLDRKLLETRLKMETAKVELFADRARELKAALDREGKDKVLSPEILKQIHEIYGLVAPHEEQTAQENAHA